MAGAYTPLRGVEPSVVGEQIKAYREGDSTLDELIDWMVARTWPAREPDGPHPPGSPGSVENDWDPTILPGSWGEVSAHVGAGNLTAEEWGRVYPEVARRKTEQAGHHRARGSTDSG